MKKLISGLALVGILATGATQAQADLLTDWTYTLDTATLSLYTEGEGDAAVNPYGVTMTDDTLYWSAGQYSNSLSPGIPKNPTGTLTFPADNSGSAEYSGSDSLTDENLLSHSNTSTDITSNPGVFRIGTLNFAYTVASALDETLKMKITYSIPLQGFYNPESGNTYVFYAASEVGTMGSTAVTYNGFKYGLTGVGLFVDGRALVTLPGEEGDTDRYSGWLINEETRNNLYSEYIIGEDNSDNVIGQKSPTGVFNITGSFSITATEVAPAPTPEPATMLLTGLGLAGLGAMKRRRNKVSVK